MVESGEEVSAAKRRRTFSAGERLLLPKLQRHIKPASEPSTESSDVKTDDTSELTKPEGKRDADGEQVLSRKDRKRKRTSVQSASEHESELAATPAKAAKADDKGAELSREGDDAVDEDGEAAKSCQNSKHPLQCSAENVKSSVKKQKRVGKLKKEKKYKNKQKPELPRLRVISKLVASVVYVKLQNFEQGLFFSFVYINSLPKNPGIYCRWFLNLWKT